MKKYLKFVNPLNLFKLPKKVWIPILLIIIAGAGYMFFGPKSDADKPQLAEVKRGTIKTTVSASGVLTGQDSVDLHFKSGGRLTYLPIKVGDSVNKGQTLASLDTQDLNISLQQAQNTFRDKDATAKKIEDDVKDHTSDETFTQKMTRTSAQAARDSAFDAVRAAQRAFSDAVITSPLKGTVTEVPVLTGQFVSAADTIVSVVNWDGGAYFDTDIDEADIAKIVVDQPAEITLNAYEDQIFPGKVEKILPQTKTTASGATVVTVRIKLSTPPAHLIANLNGQAAIIINQVANVLYIPQEALTDDSKVMVQTDNGSETKTVVAGIRSDTDVEIISGLAEHQQVITNPKP